MAAALSTRTWPRLLRPVVSRPHLMAGAAAGLAVFFLAVPLAHRAVTRGLIAWDVATAVFIVISFASMIGIGHVQMKRRAIEHDEGRHAILFLTLVSAVVSVAAIVAELGAARGAEAASHLFHVSLAAGTIALSWVFVQTVFSVHYAHVFYCAEDSDAAQ